MSATMTRGVGGSDVAAICGLSPWKTPADVFARIKLGVDSDAGIRARLGNLAEPEILKDYCERNEFPLSMFERNVEIEHPDKPWMRGELDALFRGNHLVDCKLVGREMAKGWGEDGSDYMPDDVLCQLVWYVMLADVPFAKIAAWFDAADDLLRPFDQFIELFVRADIEFAEPLEELGEVGDHRVAEHLRLAVDLASQPFGEMLDQLRQLFSERRFGQLHRLIEAGLHAAAFLCVQLR